ncbi:MAG: hypothetical protein ACRD0R_12935 [Acidimicrobiales bacterium]
MRIPTLLLIWVIIGVIVAINKGYGEVMENASNVATFALAVMLWPIPALDGSVAIVF